MSRLWDLWSTYVIDFQGLWNKVLPLQQLKFLKLLWPFAYYPTLSIGAERGTWNYDCLAWAFLIDSNLVDESILVKFKVLNACLKVPVI